MLIHSLTLKNFKTHRDRHFTFAPGTNAICGENGAGKTSLLEAIAWVLFNYRGNYTKEDLIRNGCTSAEVMVEFTSSADGLAYVVRRHSTSGYRIFDPRLGETLPYSTQEQVMPWLREQMGVAPGTDLAELFGRTVGVPQGMLTADFLLSPTQRRAVFDRILKVEDYRAAYKELGGLQKYAQSQGAAIAQAIAQWEEQLQGQESLTLRHQAVTAAIAQGEAELTALEQQLQQVEGEWQALQAQAQALQALALERQRLTGELTTQRQTLTLRQQALEQARQAQHTCDRTRPAYEAYRQAEADLRILEQQQRQRRALEAQQQREQQALATQQGELARLQERITAAQEAISTLEALAPQVAEQQALEARCAAIQSDLQALEARQRQRQRLEDQRQRQQQVLATQQGELARLQERLEAAREAIAVVESLAPKVAEQQALEARYAAIQATQKELAQLEGEVIALTRQQGTLEQQVTQLQGTVAELEELEVTLDQAPALEEQRDRLQQQRSRLAAAQQFEAELQALATQGQIQGEDHSQQVAKILQAIATLPAQPPITPILAQVTTALQTGVTLHQDLLNQLGAILEDLTSQTDGAQLERQWQTITQKLKQLSHIQTQVATLPQQQQRLRELRVEQTALATALSGLQTRLAQGATLVEELATVTQALTALENPQGRCALLQGQIQSLPSLETQTQTLETTIANTQAQLAELNQELLQVESELAQGATLAATLAEANQALTALENPRGRCALLQEQIQTLPTLETQAQELATTQQETQARLEALNQEIAPYANLDTTLAEAQQRRQTHQGGYQTYLQHEQLAQGYDSHREAVTAAEQAVAAAEATLATVTTQWQAAQGELDPAVMAQVEATYREVRSQRDRQAGSLPEKRRLAQEIQQQLDTLAAVAQERDTARAQQEQCDRALRFIQFARSTYQEAGPRITERYVHQVSREADRLFRELLNRQNTALTWTRDYDIQVQEGADTRRFINLSGGEQMCAALAVRLALLKVVASLDIAFFDEPTTNLDQPRRERLAEAISRIRSFSQLFVISHDDTFETATENVILVDRQV